MTKEELAKKYGATPIKADIAKKYGAVPASGSIAGTMTTTPQNPGFVQSMAQGIAKLPLSVVSSAANLVNAFGSQERFDRVNQEGIDYGYFGKVKPVGAGFDVTKGFTENLPALKSSVGTGLEGAAWLLGAKPFTSGALAGAGTAMQNDGSAGEVIGSTLLGGVGGKGLSLAAKGLGAATSAVGNKLLSPFRSSVVDGVQTAATRLGVPLTPAAITSSKFVKALENTIKTGPFGQSIERTVNEGRQKILASAQKLKTDLDVATLTDDTIDANTAGKALQEGLTAAKDASKTIKDNLYEAITPQIKGLTAEVESAKNALSEIIERKAKSLDPKAETESAFYQKIFDNLDKGISTGADSAPNPITYDILKQTRSDIGARLKNRTDPISSGDKAALEKLYAALSSDMEATVSKYSPEAAAAIKEANTYNREFMENFNSKMGKKIFNSENPENLIRQIIKPNDVSNVQYLKENLAPEVFEDIKAVFLADIMRASRNQAGDLDASKFIKNLERYGDATLTEVFDKSGMQAIEEIKAKSIVNSILDRAITNDVFSPAMFTKSIKSFGGEKLANILPKEIYDDLMDVSKVLGAIADGASMSEKSPTAFIARILSYTVGGVSKLIPSLVAEGALAKLYTSPFGRKLFAEGFFGPIFPVVKLGEGIQRASKYMGIPGSEITTD